MLAEIREVERVELGRCRERVQRLDLVSNLPVHRELQALGIVVERRVAGAALGGGPPARWRMIVEWTGAPE